MCGDLVKLYLLFNRDCTTNDLRLYTFCLCKLCAIFFATNCPKYARSMTNYHLDLLYIDEAHPAALEMNERTILLESCGLEFRADNVNADVPSRLKGIASFSKSVRARRWIVTRSVLSELMSHLIESLG